MQHPAYDPASRFRSLLSFMNKQFCRFLVPERELCVDETLVPTKGHNVMRQYIPSKVAKFGIKFWMLCESATGYILQMSDPVPAGILQGTRVVVDLLTSSSLLNKGYHIFCDSYFCSINLASHLLQNLTYITGIYTNVVFSPKDIFYNYRVIKIERSCHLRKSIGNLIRFLYNTCKHACTSNWRWITMEIHIRLTVIACKKPE